MYDAMRGKTNRADYQNTGEIIDGTEYDGLNPYPKIGGRYCHVPINHKAIAWTDSHYSLHLP